MVQFMSLGLITEGSERGGTVERLIGHPVACIVPSYIVPYILYWYMNYLTDKSKEKSLHKHNGSVHKEKRNWNNDPKISTCGIESVLNKDKFASVDNSLKSSGSSEVCAKLLIGTSLDIRRSSRKPKPPSKLDGFVSNVAPKKVEDQCALVRAVRKIVPVNPLPLRTVCNVSKPTTSFLAKIRPMKRPAELSSLRPTKIFRGDQCGAIKRHSPSRAKLVTLKRKEYLRAGGTGHPLKRQRQLGAVAKALPLKREKMLEVNKGLPSKSDKSFAVAVEALPFKMQEPFKNLSSEKVESVVAAKRLLRDDLSVSETPRNVFELPMSDVEIAKKKTEVSSKNDSKVAEDTKDTLNKFFMMGSEVAKTIAETLNHNEERLLCRSSAFESECLLLVEELGSAGHDVTTDDMHKVSLLLENERIERETYRQTFFQCLSGSHFTNMALYTQMLKLLKTL